jgi:hypothetical protein
MACSFFFEPYSCSMEIDLTYIGFEVVTLPSQKCVVKSKNLQLKIDLNNFLLLIEYHKMLSGMLRFLITCTHRLSTIKVEQM